MRLAVLGLLLSTLLLSGCATRRIDWNSRVGQYTYDDAITELGVPDRSATLSDGTLVAEWLTSRGSSYATAHGFHNWRFQTYDISQFPDRYMRLVFSPERTLVRAEKFAR